ncbi:chemerin-like receptor 1 [Rhynchocyon petersi]
MEDSSSVTQWSQPSGALCPPWIALCLLYSLVTLVTYLLDVVSHDLLIQVADPCLPPSLAATWFGHQATTDATFTVLLPLTLTLTSSAWPLGSAFCHLDPHLAILTIYASGRLLTRAAAEALITVLQPSWELTHHPARTAVSWASVVWLLLLILCGPSLQTWGHLVDVAESPGYTPGLGFPSPALNQLVFGFGVPLGVLSAVRWLVGSQMQLAQLTGRDPLVRSLWALSTLLFLSWFPFHLLFLLQLMGTQEPRLAFGDVWVLLRPLGFTLAGATAFLNPLFYLCGGQTFRQRLGQALLSFHVRGGSRVLHEPET